MTQYNRDMLHCNQSQCNKKDQCYRYWLGKNMKANGYQYASFYHPEKPVLEGCEFYIKKEYFE